MDEGSNDEGPRGSSPEGAARAAPEAEVEALQARLRQQQAVADLGRTVLEGTGLATLLERAAELVAGTLRVECCQILWPIPGEEQLLLRAAAGYDPALVGRATVGTDRESQAGYTMTSGEPVIVEDLRAETRFTIPGFVRDRGIVGSVSVIIRGSARPLGVLCAQATRRRAVTSDDVPFLRSVANLLALAAERESVERERADLLARAEATRVETQTLAEIGRLVTQSLDLEEVAQRIADAVLKLLAVEAAAVLSLDADSGDLRLLAVAGSGLTGHPGEIAFRRGQGLSGLAVQLRKPVFSRDVLADPRLVLGTKLRERLSRSPIRSGLAVPMLAGDAVIGVLAVGDRERDFDDEETRLVQAFAGQAAVPIGNARLHQEVRGRLAHTETLLAVSEQLTAVVDPTEMMRRIAREICRAVGADMAGAFLADPDESHLRPIAGYHVPAEAHAGSRRRAGSLPGDQGDRGGSPGAGPGPHGACPAPVAGPAAGHAG